MPESYNCSAIPLEHPNRVPMLLQNVLCLRDNNRFPSATASIVVVDLKHPHHSAPTCSSDLFVDRLSPSVDNASRNTVCIPDAIAAALKRCLTTFAAVIPMRKANSRSSSTVSMLLASASGDLAGTKKQVSPAKTRSETLPTSVATVGFPAAIYSSTASGRVSTTHEDNTPTSYAATMFGISRRCPRKRTFSNRS